MKNTYVQPSLQDHISTFGAMVRKELTILSRYPIEFVASFAQVFFIVTIFTLAGLAFSADGAGSERISGIVVYGFALFIFISDTMWTIGFNVRREQIQGTLEQLYMSPASKFSSLVSRVIYILLWTGLLVVTAVLFMRQLLGVLPVYNLGLGVVLLLLNLSGIFGVGFVFAALALHLRDTIQTMINLLQFFFMIFCAMFFPFSALPDWILVVSKLIPISYGVDIFRSTLMGYPEGFPELAPVNTEITIVVLFGLLMPILGYAIYRRAETVARVKGRFGEY